jgi:hypothetical protein
MYIIIYNGTQNSLNINAKKSVNLVNAEVVPKNWTDC